jgi:hypothetical protein
VLPAMRLAAAAEEPEKARPQAGDRFVYFSGDKKGEVVKPDDLPLGGPQVVVWPMDGATETVRSGSRLNQVLLIRLPAEELSEETKANAADGVVAYSAVAATWPARSRCGRRTSRPSTVPATAASSIRATPPGSLAVPQKGGSRCCRCRSKAASWWRQGHSPVRSVP